MDIFSAAERLMRMDDATWARHANPLSVWSRFSCLPLITLAIWSRVWLGWAALVPLALALGWTFVNPRLFAPPARLDRWASRGVLGERVFLDRAARGVAGHHIRAGRVLTGISVVGLVPLAWGLWRIDAWAVMCGLSVTMLGKVWFVDRMVWVLQDAEAEGQADGLFAPQAVSTRMPDL